jgi:multiple sugar transport system substrate-binding protein
LLGSLASCAVLAAPGLAGEVTVGSNHSDPVPRAAFQAVLDHCASVTGDVYRINTIAHNDFQDHIAPYLQGRPDDVFTWFAGNRMRFFAEQGLATPISDLWAEFGSRYSDAFKEASTARDGEQYIVPMYTYPWVVLYDRTVWDEKGYRVPATFEELLELAERMRADGLEPIAMGDQEGWPAMGTFDILDLRLNGYRFHIDLMEGDARWTDARVKAVFEAWRRLLPYYQPGALGRDWQAAAQDLLAGRAGMFFLGTFAREQATPGERDRLDFFPFPTLGTPFDEEMAIDAPINGLMLSRAPANPEGARDLLRCAATGAAQDIWLRSNPNYVGAADDVDQSAYSAFQQKAAAIIGGAGAIAQFLDRDMRADFPKTLQGFFQDFLADPDQDLDAFLQGIQDAWDILPPV